MEQQKKDVFGNSYNPYTNQYHSNNEKNKAGVGYCDNDFTASIKLNEQKSKEYHEKRLKDSNDRFRQEHGYLPISNKEEKAEKTVGSFFIMFLCFLVPYFNFIIYGALAYEIFLVKENIKEEYKKKATTYGLIATIPFATLVLPILVGLQKDTFLPYTVYGFLYLAIAFVSTIYANLYEGLKNKN